MSVAVSVLKKPEKLHDHARWKTQANFSDSRTILHVTWSIQHDWPVDNNVVTTVVTRVTLINYSFDHEKVHSLWNFTIFCMKLFHLVQLKLPNLLQFAFKVATNGLFYVFCLCYHGNCSSRVCWRNNRIQHDHTYNFFKMRNDL